MGCVVWGVLVIGLHWDWREDHFSTTVKLQIFLQPQMWSTMLPRFFWEGSARTFHSSFWKKDSGTGSPPLQRASSSMQTYWLPVCLQLQRRVRHSGRTTMGSPFTMYRLALLLVFSSKKAAQYLLATRGEPQLMTFTSLKILELRTSMQEIVERPPPRLMPVMQILVSPVCLRMAARSASTSSWMVSHIFLQAFCTLQLEQTLESTTWLAQRMSCQTLRRVLVYLKARTTKVGQTESTHFTSFSFSSMQWVWRGRLEASQTLHSQLIRSSWSSLPTIIELASNICSTQGRLTLRATSNKHNRTFILLCDRQSTSYYCADTHLNDIQPARLPPVENGGQMGNGGGRTVGRQSGCCRNRQGRCVQSSYFQTAGLGRRGGSSGGRLGGVGGGRGGGVLGGKWGGNCLYCFIDMA